MIIPIKCFTCGKVLADVYLYYLREVRKKKIQNDDEIVYITAETFTKSAEATVLDDLGNELAAAKVVNWIIEKNKYYE